MKLYIDYKTTNEPYGGINSFFKNFIECSEEFPIILVNDYQQADVILFGANSRGVKAKISLKEVEAYGNSSAIVIHRLDGIRKGFDSFVKATEAYVDGYVFQSKKGLEDYNFIKKPSVVIHNGVNQTKYFGKVTTRLSENKLKCLFVSWSDSLDKGFKKFSEVAYSHRVECTFVGRWPKSVRSDFIRKLAPIGNDMLPRIYRDHDVLIFPSRLESCSNVVLEALSSGLPVVYYEGSGVEEIVGEKYGISVGEFYSHDFEPKLRAKYFNITQNINKNIKQFSMSNTIKKYLEFLDELQSR